MTRQELIQELINSVFSREKYSEYNNEAFETKSYSEKQLHMEAFIDYYTLRLVWWYTENKKVSKCYYVNRDLVNFENVESLLSKFITDMAKTYRIDA